MNSIIKKVFDAGRIVSKLTIRVLLITVCIWNFTLINATIKTMSDLDQKTDVIAEAFSQYNKNVAEKILFPDFDKLVKVNVFIVNETKGCSGSGTLLKVDNKIIILSAGHLVDDPADVLYVIEDTKIRLLKLKKINHAVDLAIFEYVDNYTDIRYTRVANEIPSVGDSIWAIGNPAGLEDAITRGTLVRKMGIHYFIDAKIYYGSSGGGLFNAEGELVGVNVMMVGVGDYILGASVSLEIINKFIAGDISSEV
jgi:S1-C subfamily serine protease